jgi:hypothetical protein
MVNNLQKAVLTIITQIVNHHQKHGRPADVFVMFGYVTRLTRFYPSVDIMYNMCMYILCNENTWQPEINYKKVRGEGAKFNF